MRLLLAFALLLWCVGVAAQSITMPLPANCAATLVQSGSNFTVTCGAVVPPQGPIICQGYTKTLVMDFDWNNPKRLFTSNFGNFNPTDALVLRFTTGSVTSPDNLGSVHGVEYQAVQAVRHATLSLQPCDFGDGLFGRYSHVQSQSPQLYFSIGGNSVAGYAVLQTNTTYYVNVYNIQPTGCNANCNMSWDLSKPQGT